MIKWWITAALVISCMCMEIAIMQSGGGWLIAASVAVAYASLIALVWGFLTGRG